MSQESEIVTRELTKQFSPERIAEIIDRLPASMREKIIDEFLIEKPVRRTIRIICKK
jgi:hypothetical protein